MYYKIDGLVGNVVEYLEMPARVLFNQQEGPVNSIQGLALFLILGIPAVVGISLTKPIYWVAGEKIKQIAYNEEKELWERKMCFLSSHRQQELIDCLIRLKIKANSCIYDSIWQLDHFDHRVNLFSTYEMEGRLGIKMDTVLNDETKILATLTFRNKITKKIFEKAMWEIAKKGIMAKNEIKVSDYYSPLALKRCHFNHSDEWRTELKVLTRRALLKTEFMVQLEGVTRYPTRKYKEYLMNVMTNTTTLALTDADQRLI